MTTTHDSFAYRALTRLETHKVTVPTGTCDGMEVSRFVVSSDNVLNNAANLRNVLHGQRPLPDGVYTRLYGDGELWMTDAPDEIAAHMPAIKEMWQPWVHDRRVLIHGLGLGMIVGAALRLSSVAHVDVVERDERVIRLVAPHYREMADANGKTLNIVHGDALTHRWPPRSWWHVIVHDIWPDINPDNLTEMAWLKRSFGHRCAWQWCWSEKECRDVRSGTYARRHDRLMQRFYKATGLDVAMKAYEQLRQEERNGRADGATG